MRVVLAGTYPVDPQRVRGGVTAATYCLAQGLGSLPGVELHVVSANKEADRDSVVKERGVIIHQLAVPKNRILPNGLTTAKRMRAVIESIKPDVVHGQSASATLAGIKASCPTVHNIHGILHKEMRFERTVTDKAGAFLQAWMALRVVGRVKHCIAVSDFSASQYVPFTNAKVHVIFNAVDDSFFGVEGVEVAGRMMYDGYIGPLKNVAGLVRAFDTVHQECPHASLYLCGRVVHPGYNLKLTEYVESRGLQDAVNFTGYISRDDVRKNLGEASLLCLFSHQETMGIAAAQAMSAGKPVVVSSAGGLPEIVENGVNGYVVDVGDEEALARRSLELLADAGLRHRMGARAREMAEDRFRSSIVAAKILGVYEEAIASGSA